MKLREVVEEITEKVPNFLSPASIVRKVTQVRDRLLRMSTAAQQQSETVCTAIDLIAGQDQYYLPCPPGNVVDVDIKESAIRGGNTDDYRRIKLKQFNQHSRGIYYYFVGGKIGIHPAPLHDAFYGIKLFHVPTLNPLTLNDMEGETGFDPDFDMLLVYGVLRDITNGNEHQEYDYKYQQLLSEYREANSGWETHVINERW